MKTIGLTAERVGKVPLFVTKSSIVKHKKFWAVRIRQ